MRGSNFHFTTNFNFDVLTSVGTKRTFLPSLNLDFLRREIRRRELSPCQLSSKAFPHFNFALIVALAAAAASSSSYSLPLACDVTMETIR